MILNFKLNAFLFEFINPILEVNKDGRAAIFVGDGELYSISGVNNNTICLYNTFKIDPPEEKIERFNINVSKLHKGLACVKNIQDNVSLEIDARFVSYSDEHVRFKIRRLENEVVPVPKINVKMVKDFPFDIDFTISSHSIFDIKKAMEFTSETSKFYVQREGTNLYFLFGDKQSSHDNEIRVLISNNFQHNLQKENIYDVEFLRFILKSKNDIQVKLSNNGAILIQQENNYATLNYITTQLKK